MNIYEITRPWHYNEKLIVLAESKRNALSIVKRKFVIDDKTEARLIKTSGIISITRRVP